MQFRELILFLPVLLFSVVLHEYAHGWMARREGDDTAYILGRITLNPIPHIDLLGSIIFPLVLWITHAGVLFGWAKPVPVNPRKYRNYKRGDILVSLAGIISNLLLAFVCTILIIVLTHSARLIPAMSPTFSLLAQMAAYGLVINLVLAFFNLIPIPPLDGSHVLYHLLPPDLGLKYRQVGRYGMLVLLFVMMFTPGVLRIFMGPVVLLQNFAESLIRLWT